MSVADFLFNGNPPPSVTTYGTSTQNLPQWYSDYLQGVASAGNVIASQPYQPYVDASGAQIPRIAERTADQETAAQATRNMFGAFQQPVTQSINNLSSVNPMAGINAGMPGFQAAFGMSPTSAASPFLDAAAQTSVSQVGQYMSPYQDQVVDRVGDLAARQLNEKLMPAIGDNFTRAGQFGSARMQEATGRALRDVQESALAQQSQLMNQGWQQAMQAANNDLGRQGQVGQTLGQLAATEMGQLGNLGQAMGSLANTGMANYASAADSLAKVAQAGQGMALKDAAALQTVGAEQQALDQKNLDLAYSDFLTQLNYPQTQLGWLSNLLRGYQAPMSTSTTSTRPYEGQTTSGLATLASGLGGIYSLLRADGGRVTQAEYAKAQRRPKGALALMGG